MNRIIVSAALLCVAAGLVSCGPQLTPEEAAERERGRVERERAEKEATRQAELARTIEVRAAALVKEFEENEIRAGQKYDGKIVRVTGVVDSIGEDILGEGYVAFKVSGVLRNVQAMIDDKNVLAALDAGQRITVTCHEVSGGNIMGALLRDCAVD